MHTLNSTNIIQIIQDLKIVVLQKNKEYSFSNPDSSTNRENDGRLPEVDRHDEMIAYTFSFIKTIYRIPLFL